MKFIIFVIRLGIDIMSKIVAIVSSPRKNGNTDTLVKTVADAAKAKGNTVDFFYLNDMRNSRGCQACMGCKKAGKCVVNDDIAVVLNAIRNSDGVIISAADYFGQPCSQYRCLEDRFYSFMGSDFKPNIAPGKKVATIVTCGSSADAAKGIADKMTGVLVSYFKFEDIGTIAISDGGKKDAAANDADMIKLAKGIGEKF